ncbi:MAG: hypothetical protein P4L55_21580 [Syntrophobacteraceae bacterium]|nr:hypothetical protein [Syntrophobacteraceae bacterium]
MNLRDLNFRKGLLRLWIFLSVIWVAIMVVLYIYPAWKYSQTVYRPPVADWEFSESLAVELVCRLGVIVLAAVLGLVLGLFLKWVFSAFAVQEKNE